MTLLSMTTENKIIIIVGAGAVENAWLPILNAFKSVTALELDIDSANCLFARSIYLLKFYSKFPHINSKDYLKPSLENVNLLKNEICNEIKKAQAKGIIRARKEFRQVIKKFVFTNPNNKFGLISTNWDTVIDDDINQFYGRGIPCIHIHGIMEDSNNMYLPSETTQENYRTEEENIKFGYNHFSAMNLLEQANQILLYGISLDPLDAELSQVLNSTCNINKNLREIIIINPDYNRIRNRVKILLFPHLGNDVKIRCYIPENLEEEL